MNLYLVRIKYDKTIVGIFYGRNILKLGMELDHQMSITECECFRIGGYYDSVALFDKDSINGNGIWDPDYLDGPYDNSYAECDDNDNKTKDVLAVYAQEIDNRIKNNDIRKNWIDLYYIECIITLGYGDEESFRSFWSNDRKIIRIIKKVCKELEYEFGPYPVKNPPFTDEYYKKNYSELLKDTMLECVDDY